MKYLIVNADDFGYSYSINRGIIEAHTNGVITSTSVLVDAVAAHEATELSKYPNLSVGLHFEVKDFSNVAAELDRQVDKFKQITGQMPTHIDTHKIHTDSPQFSPAVPEFCQKYNIPARQLSGVAFIRSFMGLHTDGDVSIEQFKKAVDQATDEYNEIMTHVGYSDDYLRGRSSYNGKREEELKTICDPAVKQYIKDKGLKLINWKDFSTKQRQSIVKE